MTEATSGLQRSLSRSFALAVIVGGIIGVGVLRTPGEIAEFVQSPWVFVGLWLIGGIFVLMSCSVTAELVGMTNRSGGTYAMVRRAYGPFPAFVIGWTDWLSFVGDIAFKAVVIIEFINLLTDVPSGWHTPLAVLVTTVFAALQLRGLHLGARVQQIAAASIAVIVVGFAAALLLAEPVTGGEVALLPPFSNTGAWSLVIAAIILTYDGWTWAAYFNGETHGGPGAVARSCIKGVLLVIFLYLLLMSALAFSVPLSSLAGSDLALATALELAVSPAAATAVIGLAIMILFAHQNLLYLSAPRILHALAVDGLAIKRASKVSSNGNMLAGVIISWAVTVFLVLVGGFEFLLYLVTFFYLAMYLVCILGVVILRRRQPDVERPFRAWGHPWNTGFCLVGWATITAYQAWSAWDTALIAAGLVLVAWPIYRYLQSNRG